MALRARARAVFIVWSFQPIAATEFTSQLYFTETNATSSAKLMGPGRSTYERYWKPALVAAGLIAPPVKDSSGIRRFAVPSRKYGRHQLRHYYANMQLSGGTNIRELADYLGHHDPSFTLRVYGHLQPDSHERARRAVDAKFFRPHAVSDGF